jgi:hypothetical protein
MQSIIALTYANNNVDNIIFALQQAAYKCKLLQETGITIVDIHYIMS